MTTKTKGKRTVVLSEERIEVLQDVVFALRVHGELERSTKLEVAFGLTGAGVKPDNATIDQPLAGDIGAPLALSDDANAVRFPGSDTMPRSHPRVQARRRINEAPSLPPLVRADETWQINCLWERWRFRVGELDYGRWQKPMKTAMDVYLFSHLWNAIEAFAEHRQSVRGNAFVPNFPQFVDDLREFVRIGQMPWRNEVGDLTYRGRKIFPE